MTQLSLLKLTEKNFDVSFFEKLFLKLDKKAKSSFNVQYRMHPSINNYYQTILQR